MLCNISLCRYFKDSAGAIVGIFLACRIHCVSSGMRRRGNLSIVLLRWASQLVFNRNKVLVIGDLIQSWCDMRVRFCAPPCLASMCFTNPLYILPSLPLSLRVLISCSPMHVMYAF